MIEFPCPCGRHQFSLQDDEAGGLAQCPICHRLNDVPKLAELSELEADGGYRLSDDLIKQDPQERIASVARAFGRQKSDTSGNEIDLRPTFDDVLDAGTDDGPIPLADDPPIDTPKYDPLTGELIKPLDIKVDPTRPPAIDPKKIPMASRAISYAGADLLNAATFKSAAIKLFEPINLLVMTVILAAHGLLEPVNLMMLLGVFFVAPIFIIGVIFFLAHYGNVIDEIGPSDRDELPRPLRDISLSEDIWRPFTQVAGALILCFLPAIVATNRNAPDAIVWGLELVGAYFLPAVLLTLTTSGTSMNLRPDRIFAVIRTLGLSYLALPILFIVAGQTYWLGLRRFNFDFATLFASRSARTVMLSNIIWWFQPWVAYPCFVLGLYLMHWFCWNLGLWYRQKHGSFPWILQRHVPTKLADRNRPSPNYTRNSALVKAKLSQPPAPARLPR